MMSFGAVFSAGLLSFLSPCVLPLVPAYLCYISGLTLEELRAKNQDKSRIQRFSLFFSALCFILGFSTIFIGLGASATSIGKFLNAYHSFFAIIAGILIILMGLNILGVWRLPLLNRELRFHNHKAKPNLISPYIMGLAFAFGWTPCIGPILGPILALAASRHTVSEGAALLAVYCLGLALPFLAAALFSNLFWAFFKKFRSYLGWIEKLMGILLVITGIFFITGQMEVISGWLLDALPALSDL